MFLNFMFLKRYRGRDRRWYINVYAYVWNYLNNGHVLAVHELIYTLHVLHPRELTSTVSIAIYMLCIGCSKCIYVMYRSDGAANAYTLCIGAMVQSTLMYTLCTGAIMVQPMYMYITTCMYVT